MKSFARRASAVVLVLALLACDTPAAPSDAGTDAAASLPAPPVFTPCPSGWRTTSDASGLALCDPWPESGYHGADCAADEAHFPGTDGCVRLGPACPDDGWPADLPTDRPILYVDDDAAPGGDGLSRATALRSIQAATHAMTGAVVVAIATGTYAEEVSVADDTSIIGACVAGVRLTPTRSDGTPVLVLLGQRSTARSLTIDAPGLGALQFSGTDGVAEDIAILSGTYGIFGAGGNARVSRASIRGIVVPRLTLSAAIEVQGGSQLTLDHIVLDGATAAAGMSSSDGFGGDSSIDASDVAILDMQLIPGFAEAPGIEAYSQARLSLHRAVVERPIGGGVIVDRMGHVDATDVVIRDIVADARGIGDGVYVSASSSASLSRVWIARPVQTGLLVTGDTCTLDASDLVVTDVQSTGPADSPFGSGAWAQLGAHMTITRGLLARTIGVGLEVASAASATVNGLVVSGVGQSPCAMTTCPDFEGGFGLAAHFGGQLVVTDFAISDVTLCGIVVGEDGSGATTAVDLTHGTIARAPVGACVQVDGYDSERLHHDVLYQDVGVPLQATSYALPQMLQGAGP